MMAQVCWVLLVMAALLGLEAAVCKDARPTPLAAPSLAAPRIVARGDLEAAATEHIKPFYLPPVSGACPQGQMIDLKGKCRGSS